MINQQAIAAEEDVKMIQRLCLTGKTPAVIAFSSVEPGSGCSWVVSRVARALVKHTTQSVCIIDADFRDPSQHRHFGINAQKGFAHAILGNTPVRSLVQQIPGNNLWVLPAGATSGETYRLLLSNSVRDRIEELRKEFDYILIDTPATGLYADATLIGRWTDGMVLVIAADSTRQETAVRAREDAAVGNIPVLGAVLNKRTYPVPEALYRAL